MVKVKEKVVFDNLLRDGSIIISVKRYADGELISDMPYIMDSDEVKRMYDRLKEYFGNE